MTPVVAEGIMVMIFFIFVVVIYINCIASSDSSPRLVTKRAGHGVPGVDPASGSGGRYYPYMNLPLKEH